ncbi:hypothetical protein PSYJYH_000013 [Bacillus phage PSYJ-YH]|nr:hypothetical protein PSYJYH_000013 [Bacillus phage PSYJ-YH]
MRRKTNMYLEPINNKGNGLVLEVKKLSNGDINIAVYNDGEYINEMNVTGNDIESLLEDL